MGTGTQYKEELQEKATTLIASDDERNKAYGAELQRIVDAFEHKEEDETPIRIGNAAYNRVGDLASDIEEVALDWLWTGRIATGFVNMFFGEPAAGKSTFWADLVARVTTGRPLPDGEQSVPGGVVIVSVEEPSQEVLVPRLRKMGADLSRVCILSDVTRNVAGLGGTTTGKFELPTDLPLLEAAIKRVNATLVIIDPLAGVSAVSIYVNQTARRKVMEPLQSMAYRLGVAVLMVGHFIKGSAKDTNLLFRCGGSEGIVAHARSVMAMVNDGGNNDQRVLMTIKRSLSKPVPQIIARMNEHGQLEYVHGQLPSVEQVAKATKYSQARQNILALINSEPDRPFNAAEITHTLDLENPNVRKHLSNLCNEGLIGSPARGLYQAIVVAIDSQDSQPESDSQDSQDSQGGIQVQKAMSHEEYVQAVNAPTVPLDITQLPEDQQTIVLNVLNGKGIEK